jgi:hypothetical protein
MPRRPVLGLVVVAAALAACAARSADAPGDVICGIAPPPPYLVYPEDGATNVPDGVFTLVIQRAAPPVSLEIGSAVAVSNLAATAVPSPLPSPSTPNAVAGAAYAVPSLEPHTTYRVFGVYGVSGCHPDNYAPPPQPIGSFTTQ